MARAWSSQRLFAIITVVGLSFFQLRAEEFEIQLGDSVAPASPGPGAGNIGPSAFQDRYAFAADAGAIMFVEVLSSAPALQGWLRWELKAPSGKVLWNGLFASTGAGRVELTESGTYTIRCFASGEDPARVGDYSFRLRPVPPDQKFTVSIGARVEKDRPATGAGQLEVAGARDIYTFRGDAGAHVFFEEISSAAAFKGTLRWECLAPSGQKLFSGIFQPQAVGRKTLAESGSFTIRFFVGDSDPTHIGEYAFALRAVPQDQTFPLEIGATISDGVPGPGAGRLEVPGARDIYTFSATAGQIVVFEEVRLADSFGGALRWEARGPSGQALFAGLFGPGSVGRKTLPETGTYSLVVFGGDNDPQHVGEYAFKTSAVQADSTFPVRIGDTIARGVSAPGTGEIESVGAQDTYTFQGTAGQELVLERLAVAEALAGALRWELKGPGDQLLFSELYRVPGEWRARLPETGTYALRFFAGDHDAAHVGTYTFRLLCEVFARADNVITTPETPLAIPFARLGCNDTHDATDEVQVELVANNSEEGGTLHSTPAAIVYTPKAGFTGRDSFAYRLRGKLGGQDIAAVTVWVFEGADHQAAVVSVNRKAAAQVEICLLGTPQRSYTVDSSDDLATWVKVNSLDTDEMGGMRFVYAPDGDGRKFYRFRSVGP